jgi:hypothetical protein
MTTPYSISSTSSALRAIISLYITPACLIAAVAWLAFLLSRSISPPPGSSRMSLAFFFHAGHVSIRLSCAALYFIINIMHYVPLVLAAWPISSLPPPPSRLPLLSVLPITTFLTPIFLFFINNAGLFLLGLYTVAPPPKFAAALSRSLFSTLLTHDAALLSSIACAGMSFTPLLPHVMSSHVHVTHVLLQSSSHQAMHW